MRKLTPIMQRPALSHLFLCLFLLHSLHVSSQETTIVVTSSPTPSPASPSYTDPKRLEQDALDNTNYYRSQYNASALTWNDTLANYAQRWSDQCHWAHSVRSPRSC